jgi:FlaG/FlaF family flagellin (archaellin)
MKSAKYNRLMMRLVYTVFSLSIGVVTFMAGLTGGLSFIFAAPASTFDVSTHVQLNSSGIDVIWVSDAEEDGFVEYAFSADGLANQSGTFAIAQDIRGALGGRVNKKSHRVRVVGTPSGSTIHFNVVSGGVKDGPHQVIIPTTALTSPPTQLSGNIKFGDGSAGRECIIRMRVGESITLFGQTFVQHSLWTNILSNGGQYAMDITNIRQDPSNLLQNNFNNALSYSLNSSDTTITVHAQCDDRSEGTIQVTTADVQKDAGGNFINVDVTVALAPTVSIAPATTSVVEGDTGTTPVNLIPNRRDATMKGRREIER